jgi:hypothetical protein
MDRKTAIQVIKVAGYHGDTKTFMRTYCENRISFAVADNFFRNGKQAKLAGMKCDCNQCKKEKGE